MDGNFSAEHMKYRTRETDVPLSPGMAFMANPDLYKAHLRSGAAFPQVGDRAFELTIYAYCMIWSDSPVHATRTEQLSKPIQIGHI